MARTNRRSLAGAALVLALGLVAGCSSSPSKESDPTIATSTLASTASSGTPSPPPAQLGRFYGQRLVWKGCRDGFRCARVVVPLDYSAPEGRTISIAVNRLPAGQRGRRIGSLVVNPGGPGVSGLSYARATTGIVSQRLLDRFDLVGFDPRGVGASSPVHCLGDKQTDAFLAADGSPDDATEEQQLVSVSHGFVDACRASSGGLIGHLSTRDAARDLDIVRAALGDKRLFYLGKSYGTYLGATYADLFPSHVGRLVLDGVVDPNLSSADSNRSQALGFERALRSFAADCARRGSCPYRGGRDRVLTSITALLNRIDVHPLPGDPGRPLTQALATVGIAYGLYDKSFWDVLRDALSRAEKGDGTTLLTMSDLYADRDENGHYTTNTIAALFAVNCSDRPEEQNLDVVRRRADVLAAQAPHFGAYLAWSSLPCAYWPASPAHEPPALHATGAPPILLVGTTRDPATPYAGAKALARQLSSARLLTYVGDGHTAYRGSSSCIDGAVDAYLVAGTLPPDGKRCH